MGVGHGLKQFLPAIQQNKLCKTRHAPTVEMAHWLSGLPVRREGRRY